MALTGLNNKGAVITSGKKKKTLPIISFDQRSICEQWHLLMLPFCQWMSKLLVRWGQWQWYIWYLLYELAICPSYSQWVWQKQKIGKLILDYPWTPGQNNIGKE